MSTAPGPSGRPDYGLDAPGVVRNLFLAGAAGLLLWLTVVLGLWSGVVLHVQLAAPALCIGASFMATGSFMLWASKVGKVRRRERLLDRIAWKGDETVLDVGCGRGLLLTAAARRLTTGRAVGIDVWHAEDLSGNRPEATLENARREGVADRVAVRTADMRQLPFADGSFDVVVSRAAIHNLYAAKDREQAVREIARVLKPGGVALIDDIRHGNAYLRMFAENGCPGARVSPPWVAVVTGVITWGSVRPVTLLVRKAA